MRDSGAHTREWAMCAARTISESLVASRQEDGARSMNSSCSNSEACANSGQLLFIIAELAEQL